MIKNALIAVLAGSLLVVGCDDGAKKAAELAASASASAKEAADKAKVELEAKAKEAAKAALDTKKGDLKKQITTGLGLADQKLKFLKEKADKLPAPAKKKADEAFAAVDKAKATVTGLTASIDGLSDIAGAGDIATKITSGLEGVTKAVSEAEAIVVPPAKK
jgi:hypothetical protein